MAEYDELADVVALTIKAALAPIAAECAALKVQLATLAELTREMGALRERIAVAEVRQLVAGPPGKDGADGVGFEEMHAAVDDERRLMLTWTKDGRTRTCGVYLPIPKYQGTFTDGKMYAPGDIVTHGGSAWHCHEPTGMKPGDGPTGWQLMVKRGRDGPTGPAGRDLHVPVVKTN